jgi:hypothetical protein
MPTLMRLAQALCRKLAINAYIMRTCGLVAMTSVSHAEGRQFDPGQVYFTIIFSTVDNVWAT